MELLSLDPDKHFKHGIHPLIKLALLIILNILIFLPETKIIRLPLIAVEVILFYLVKLRWYEIRGFFKILLLNFPVFFLLFYFVDYSWSSAFFLFLDYALTVLLMFLGSFIFWKATPLRELIYALRKVGIPTAGAFGISISVNLMPLISEKIRTIIRYQQARGYRFSIFHLAPVLIASILNLLEISTDLALSLESRGFSL